MTPRETLTAEQLRERAASTEEQLMQGGAISAAGQGMARALAGPLPDYIATQTMTPEELSVLRRQEEKHQIAGMAGSLLGYVGGALTGAGVPGLLTKGAAAAGRGVGVFAGEIAGKGVGSALGTVARHGLEGGGIALSEATGRSLIDRELGVPGSAGAIASAVGTGMAFGGLAGGVLGVALPRTADYLFAKTFNKRIKMVGDAAIAKVDAHKKRIALTKQLESFEQAHTPQSLAAYRGMIKDNPYNLISGDPTRHLARQTQEQGRWMHLRPFAPGERAALEAAAQAGDKSAQARLADFAIKGGDTPEFVNVLRAIERSDEKIKNTLTKSLTDLGEKAREGVTDGVGDVAALAIGGPKTWLIKRLIAPSAAAIQSVIYKGMMKTPAVRWAMSNSLMSGKASKFYKKMGVVDGELQQIATSFDKYIEPGRAAISALKVPPLTVMTSRQFREIREELEQANLAAYSTAISSSLAAHGVPQEAAVPMIGSAQAAIAYVASNLPPPTSSVWSDEDPVIPESVRRATAEDLRASLLPITVIHDFLAGKLTPRAAKAWWATQPEVAEAIAEIASNAKDVAEAFGQKYTSKQKEQLGLLIDQTGMTTARTKSKSLLQYMQGQRMQEEQQTPAPQPGGPPAPGSPKAAAGINQNSLGPSQELGNRLARR